MRFKITVSIRTVIIQAGWGRLSNCTYRPSLGSFLLRTRVRIELKGNAAALFCFVEDGILGSLCRDTRIGVPRCLQGALLLELRGTRVGSHTGDAGGGPTSPTSRAWANDGRNRSIESLEGGERGQWRRAKNRVHEGRRKDYRRGAGRRVAVVLASGTNLLALLARAGKRAAAILPSADPVRWRWSPASCGWRGHEQGKNKGNGKEG